MAYYAEKDFFEDDELIALVTSILEGNLTLDWYRVDTPRLRAKPADPARGLTYEDCNLGPYGYDAIPEFLRDRYSMAARGSASVSAEQALKELLTAETYPEASLAANLLLGSFVLAMYRALAAVSRTRADRLLGTLSMQDVARSVAYGVAHMRYHLGHQPGQAVALADYLDRSEHTVLGIAGSPEFLEPLVLLAAGSREPDALARGAAFVRRWFTGALEEYLERCGAAGLGNRRERSRLPRLAAALAA